AAAIKIERASFNNAKCTIIIFQAIVVMGEAAINDAGDLLEITLICDRVDAVALPKPGRPAERDRRLLEELGVVDEVEPGGLAAFPVIILARDLDGPAARVFSAVAGAQVSELARLGGAVAGDVVHAHEIVMAAELLHINELDALVRDLREEGAF